MGGHIGISIPISQWKTDKSLTNGPIQALGVSEPGEEGEDAEPHEARKGEHCRCRRWAASSSAKSGRQFTET